jgi:hypothetical protein
MQDRYAGDLGDYAKCGLVRVLCGRALPLGLIWYLVPDEAHNADGRHIDYLRRDHRQRRRLEPCDPALHAALAAMVLKRGERSVAALERLNIWPAGTCFFSERLDYTGVSKPDRPEHRRQWLRRSLDATDGAAVVCVDPDNGLETPSSRPDQSTGNKYVFLDELQRFWNRGQSLIIYQHANRRGTAAAQAAQRKAQLREYFASASSIKALRFRRGPARLFFLVSQPVHEAPLAAGLTKMLHQRWADHFTLINQRR